MSGTGLEVSPDMTPEDVLAHYGKKGMRWGHTTTSDAGGGSSFKKPKATSDDIKDARENLRRQATDLRKAKKEVKKTTAKGSAERLLGDSKVAEMKVDLLNNPDRVTALKLTKGEKIVFGVIAVTPGGVGAVAGTSAVRALQRRQIEKKQKSGSYYK